MPYFHIASEKFQCAFQIASEKCMGLALQASVYFVGAFPVQLPLWPSFHQSGCLHPCSHLPYLSKLIAMSYSIFTAYWCKVKNQFSCHIKTPPYQIQTPSRSPLSQPLSRSPRIWSSRTGQDCRWCGSDVSVPRSSCCRSC